MELGRLDPSTQALYAEFVDRLRLQDVHRSAGDLPGTFVTKTIHGKTYHYFQFSKPGGLTRQIYLGEHSGRLTRLIEQFNHERSAKAGEKADLTRLCAQLRAGRAALTSHPVARVLKALSDSGIFRLGGTLVGTHAFTVLGNVLGVVWPPQTLQTLDVDVAIPPVGVLMPSQERTDIPDLFERLGMGFLPVPPLNRKQPSTSFKVRGKPLRVDILTPVTGNQIRTVFLPRLNTGATGLPYLDFLLAETVEGGIIAQDGILVRVPSPARFAVHKLVISQLRGGTEIMRTSKDILQAAQVLSALAADRPGDIREAWEAAGKQGKRWMTSLRYGLQALSRQFPDIYATLPKHL